MNNKTSISNNKVKSLVKSETVTLSDALENCSDAVHLCSANFSHQSAQLQSPIFQCKMADDFICVNRNVFVNFLRHRQSLHVFVCQPRM